MYFQYDNKGVPLGFVLNGTQYFYITNQMGDVVAITESNGDIIGEYVYDEWGYILSENTMDPDTDPEPVKAVEMNPIRYRGYCYDRETGYYYLRSRYYDPSICRFINADSNDILQQAKDIIIGLNLYVYCYNNPINTNDITGFGQPCVAFIVYSKNGSDFVKQSDLMKKKIKNCSIKTYYCKSASEFVSAWNHIAKYLKLKDLFLYIHGDTGKLYFNKCSIVKSINSKQNAKKPDSQKDRSFSDLRNLSITGKIYLNSCHGGTSKSGVESVASILSKKVPGHSVRAVVNGNVYYRSIQKPIVDGTPLTKEKGAYWADFNYHYVTRERQKMVCISKRRSYWKYD